MNYILDTNIILTYLRKHMLADEINKRFRPFQNPNISIICVVSMGEIRSLAIRNNWGNQRTKLLGDFLRQFLIADINVETVIQRYAEIDAYSQGKFPGKPLSMSARNMGKNDLWIAATASVLNATLLTLDHDFDHLKNEFIQLETIEI